MNSEIKNLLEDILVAEILALARDIKSGQNTTSDCIADAIKLVRQKRADVLRLLAETR